MLIFYTLNAQQNRDSLTSSGAMEVGFSVERSNCFHNLKKKAKDDHGWKCRLSNFWFIEYFLGLSTQQKFYWPSAGEALRVRSVPQFMHWGRRGGWMIPGCKTTVVFRCISPFCKPPSAPSFASTLPFLFWRLQKRAPLVFLSASCKKFLKKNVFCVRTAESSQTLL